MAATATDYSSVIVRIAGPFLVYAVSLAIVLVLKRVPLLRRLVP